MRAKARGIRPGVFQVPGKEKPRQFVFAVTTIRPGEDEGYYKSGWIDYVGLYMTPSLDLMEGDPKRTIPASDGMHGYLWRNRKFRHVAWASLPKWWQKWFVAHLDREQRKLAKEN